MVRLQKAVFEQVANIKMLGRERVISKPVKWYQENRKDAMKVAAHNLFNEGITGWVFRTLEPLISKLHWNWIRDIAQQRGFAMEDFLLFQDRELRRCFLFEHVMRSNFHPYQWVLFKRRRARYYKVERGVRGFFVQDFVRKEADDRLLSETIVNREEWDNFMYKEIMSDQTPAGHFSVLNKLSPLDLISAYGWFRYEAWDRLFYNEPATEGVTKKQVREAVMNPFGSGHNLANSEGRARFEAEVNRFIKIYPGTVVREGEKFDFNRFYAAEALVNGRETTQFDSSLIETLKAELQNGLQKPQDKKSGAKSVLGTKAPEFLTSPPGQSIF